MTNRNDRRVMAEVNVFYRQGEEFGELLKAADGDVGEAFGAWSKLFRDRMDLCQRVAEQLRDVNVTASGDTNYIGIEAIDEAADRILASLIEAGELIKAYDFDVDQDIADDFVREEDTLEL